MEIKKWMVNVKVRYYDLHFEFDNVLDAASLVRAMSGHYTGSNDEDGTELTLSIYPVLGSTEGGDW